LQENRFHCILIERGDEIMSTLKILKAFSIGLMCGTSLCFATDIIQENKENMPLKISLKSIELIEKDELSKLVNQQTIKIGQKDYMLDIHDTVKNAVISGILSKDKVQDAFEVIENKKPNEKVVGYSLGLYKGKICINPFLGNNAD
jgi:hypothetical protein